MRDLYKLVLFVPVIILLMVFAVRLTDGEGIDLEAGPGIQIDYQGEDFLISAPDAAPLRFYDYDPPAGSAPSPRLAIVGSDGIEVDLRHPDADTAEFDIELDYAAVGRHLTGSVPSQIRVWDSSRTDGQGDPDPGYQVVQDLQIDARAPASITPQYNASGDELTLTIDGGLPATGNGGQVLTWDAGASPPSATWQDAPTELPTAGTDGHVLTLVSGSPAWQEVTGLQTASVTLTAAQIRDLDSRRIEVVPAPGANKYILVRDLLIFKTGNAAISSVPDAKMGLAVESVAGGLLTSESSSAYASEVSNSAGQWFPDGDYVKAGQATDHLLTADTPLVVYGYASASGGNTAAQQWDSAVAAIGTSMTVRFVVRYEIVEP